MKRIYVWTAALLAMTLATACMDETPAYKIEPENPGETATGYLMLASSGLSVVIDAETDQDTEAPSPMSATRAGTDLTTGLPNGDEAAATNLNDFRVTIRPTNGGTPVFQGTYSQLKSRMQEHQLGMAVPVGIYELSATSNSSATGKPDQVQALPSYAGSQSGISVTKANGTNVDPVVCKLQNIKISLEVAADLYTQLAPVDNTHVIDATIYYGDNKESAAVKWEVPASWNWKSTNPKAVYFPSLNDNGNLLHLSFRAKLKETGRIITMNKDIANILPGQWRRIKVIPKYDTTGNITFDVEISSFVQDETIVVGPNGDISMTWSELPYFDPDDPSMAAPAIRWADGSAIPDPIEVGVVPMQDLVIAVPNGLAKLGLSFQSNNPDFQDDASLLTNDDLCSVARNPLLDLYGIPYGDSLRGQEEITFSPDAIVSAIRDYEGTYTFTFIMTDNAGFTSEQDVRFLVGEGGAELSPMILWAGGTLYNESGYDAQDRPIEGMPFVQMRDGMQIVVQLTALPNFESISVKITSDVLNAELLAAAGLTTEFDLCNLQDFVYDGDNYTAASQAKVLTENLKLIDKVNEDLKREHAATFNISPFVEIMTMLGENEKFQFALTVRDGEGRSMTRYLRLQNPAE